MGNSNSQGSPWSKLGGSHHLPPYSIFCAFPWGPHLNNILSWDSQVGVPKFSQLEVSWLWGPITLRSDLRLKWCLKQSCSPCRELFNSMLHATCMQGNRVYSWLLVVGNQTANSTSGLSFGHNLCFRCPNGWCEPILDIDISITFQWYKKLFNALDFDPCNRSLNIWEFIGTPIPKVGVPLGAWGFIPSHSLAFSGACGMTPGLPSWLATLQPFALVVNPRLGLCHVHCPNFSIIYITQI
jgi:hypothetical protein